MISKPMLAVAMDSPDNLKYPVLASPKLDGIRCLIHPELGPVSRKFKPIPNVHIRNMLNMAGPAAFGLDGELVTLNDDGSIRTFNEIQGDVMRKDGMPRYKFLVFDSFRNPGVWFNQRLVMAKQQLRLLPDEFELVEHTMVTTPDGLRKLDEQHVAAGYEGTMTRDPNGPYKQGRSTLKQGLLLKLKQWADAEGVVTGFEERMHNANAQETDELGHAKRSSSKDGLVPAGTLGAVVLDTEWGELRVGSGYNDELRDHVWRNLDHYLGAIVTFKYQPSGMQDKPRFPIFKGFRHEDDT